MKKKFVAALIALALAAFGVLALVNYARGANTRAFAGAEMVDVLQVQADIPAQTPSDRLERSVKIVKVPVSARVDGALGSLEAVAGKSTNSPLKKGEQVLRSRFGGAAPAARKSDVPPGYQEITLSLEPQRIGGGKVQPGDLVGIVASYEDATNFLNQRVRVTRVSSAVAKATEAGGEPVLVTLAVKTLDAEKIANAAEFGKIWLTAQSEETDLGEPRTVTKKDVAK